MKENYKYLRIGNKRWKHLVFEFSPENELSIIVGETDYAKYRQKLSREELTLLIKWINKECVK